MSSKGNAVRFIYLSAGNYMPVNPDADSIYFLEEQQQLYVGNVLIADHIDPVDVSAYLESYHVKDVQVTGSGNVITDVALDDGTGKLIFTKGEIEIPETTIAKGVDIDDPEVELHPGDTFTAIVDTAVSGRTITDENGTFKLPHQITSVGIKKNSDGTVSIVSKLSDNSEVEEASSVFGSAAFEDADKFATAEQGQLAESAMQAQGGVATGAKVELASDPENPLDAATKRYVDNSIVGLSGAMHLVGISSTVVTEGGRELPTIDGEAFVPSDGDVVLYDDSEYVWANSHWNRLGTDSSFALKSTEISAGDGLVGGGQLSGNVEISHDIAKIGEFDSINQIFNSDGRAADIDALSGNGNVKIQLIEEIAVDEFGHVTSASYKDVTSYIAQLAKYVAEKAMADVDASGIIREAVRQANAYTDEKIQEVVVEGGDAIWNVESGTALVPVGLRISSSVNNTQYTQPTESDVDIFTKPSNEALSVAMQDSYLAAIKVTEWYASRIYSGYTPVVISDGEICGAGSTVAGRSAFILPTDMFVDDEAVEFLLFVDDSDSMYVTAVVGPVYSELRDSSDTKTSLPLGVAPKSARTLDGYNCKYLMTGSTVASTVQSVIDVLNSFGKESIQLGVIDESIVK